MDRRGKTDSENWQLRVSYAVDCSLRHDFHSDIRISLLGHGRAPLYDTIEKLHKIRANTTGKIPNGFEE